ncbi:hypothetical protein AMELA_G00077450 [Ameiurus melas]|uniref:Uncharacterized protein n=1 Tax=Ameiurus melas TaxID=219545 RepID=A0A7J6AZ72_AMEME|nr:hypothetical protein AMELA_G00077450 [Ameiurus melas]
MTVSQSVPEGDSNLARHKAEAVMENCIFVRPLLPPLTVTQKLEQATPLAYRDRTGENEQATPLQQHKQATPPLQQELHYRENELNRMI